MKAGNEVKRKPSLIDSARDFVIDRLEEEPAKVESGAVLAVPGRHQMCCGI